MSNRQSDLIAYVSTTMPATYGASAGLANYNRKWLLGPGFPTPSQKKDGRKYCGGRYFTGYDLLARDTAIAASGKLYPDMNAWVETYLFGGGAAYVVSGSAPFLHTNKKNDPVRDYPDAFSVIYNYAGSANYYEWTGCQLDNYKINIPEDTTAPVTYEGAILTKGSRTKITSGFTPPVCVEELCYRAGDVAVTFAIQGGATLTNQFVGGSLEVQNDLQKNPRRSGLYVANYREYINRRFVVTASLLGAPGDALEDAWDANSEFVMTVAFTNPTTNRVLTRYMPDLSITAFGQGYSEENNKHTHVLTLEGVLDDTDATTQANTPMYSTAQTGTATYRA